MPKKIYSPARNPFAKSIPVRPTVTRQGKFRRGHLRRPRYRKRIF